MILPLATDIEMVRGVGPHTFTRASSQYMNDFEGRLRKALSGKAGFPGMRLVENLLTAPNDFSNAAWVKTGSCTVSGTDTVNLPAVGDSIYQTHSKTISEGEKYSGAVMLSGSGTVSIRISRITGGVYQGNDRRVALSATPKRYSVQHQFVAGPTVIAITIMRVDAGDTATQVTASKAQLENVTNQSNQNPSEFPLDGQSQWFDYLNPNTVDANGVVTDSGVRTKITGGKGGLLEPLSTNKFTGYGVPRADALGSELIVNAADREFSSDTGFWSKTAGSTISGGALNIISDGTLEVAHCPPAITAGKFYTLTFTATVNSGTAAVADALGSTFYYTIINGSNSLTFLSKNNNWQFKRVTACNVSIDNVSCKEAIDYVGTKAYHDGTAFQNPITGMTLSGDVAAVLSIVTDQAAIEAAGLAKQTNGWKLYDLDNPGAATAWVTGSGAVGNLNPHALSVIGKVVSGSGLLTLSGLVPFGFTNTSLAVIKKENATPLTTGGLWSIGVSAGCKIRFLAPQLEEQPYATSIMPTLGAAATRAATVSTVPRAGNLPATGLRRIVLQWTSWGSVTGTTQCLWSSYVDASNYVALWANNAIVYGEKRVAGVSEFVTFVLTPTLMQTYEIDFGFWPDNTMFLKVDGVSAGSGLGSELMSSAQQQFDSGWIPNDASAVMTGGKGVYTNALATKGLYLPAISTIGRVYKLGITIDSITAGGIALRPGVGEQGPTYTIPGTYSAVLFALSDSNMRIYTEGASTTAVIDNGSIREVYNNSTTLAPVLGSLITHGSINGTKHCFGQLKNINTDR
ncbi:MAG: hypothetical protein KKH22_12060 [Proteobacteria bacterium]|nr:hypothetical protein [Pseudomonadota bacterium]